MFNKLKNYFPLLCRVVLLSFVMLMAVSAQAKEQKCKIVATTTLWAELVKQIAGDKAEVQAIASPKFNVHFYPPKPSDVRKVAQSDLYVSTGLDLEAWSDPLLEAAGKPQLFRGGPRFVDLSAGIKLLEAPTQLSRAEGDIHVFGNPHYAMNPENAKIMAKTILTKLIEIDPENREYYETNTQSFLTKLDEKIREWKKLCSHCRGKEVISYHDDMVYLADFLGLKAEQSLEPKPGIPPTPKHLNFLENYIREHNIKAIVSPTFYSPHAPEKLAKRTGIKTVTICQNAGEVKGTEDFFKFFDYNIQKISEAVQ